MMNVQQVPQGGGMEFERWSEAMRGEFDAFLHETWQAMNEARSGYWIADTEEVMRQARDRLGQRAYQKLLQLRLDAGEAGEPGRPGEVGREARGGGLFPPTDSQTPWRNKGRKPITHLTAIGHVEVVRRIWWNKQTGTASPGDGWRAGR